jgi:hypothetical protein
MRKAKQDAFRLYNRWRKQKIYCPAFKQNVRFSLKGWRHITGATGSKKRNYKDVYRRLKLLPHAKTITQKSTTIQNIVKRKGRTFYILEAVVAVREGGRITPRKVRVVYEEDKQGKKVFLSVMDKKKYRRKK